MGLIALDCRACGAALQVDEQASTYTCKYCQTVHQMDYTSGCAPTPASLQVVAERAFERGEFGKAMQFVEQGLAIDPHDRRLIELETRTKAELKALGQTQEARAAGELEATNRCVEAEQYRLQAEFILNQLQANMQVFGSNSAVSGATPANIELAIQYIDRSLQNDPRNGAYLNLKALLLWEGLGEKERAIGLLERAARLNPRDINIQNNLKAIKTKSSSCFIATAAYGTPLAVEVQVLRDWRDRHLLPSILGRQLVRLYCALSPPIARLLVSAPNARRVVRWCLRPIVLRIREHEESPKNDRCALINSNPSFAHQPFRGVSEVWRVRHPY